MADLSRTMSSRIDADAMRDEMASWDDLTLAAWYMRGMCGPFAVSLHEMTGWPTYGVFDTEGGLFGDKPRHVGCRAPDGTFVDARGGGLDAAGFADGFRTEGAVPLVVRPLSAGEIRSNYRARTDADWLLADEHVRRLLPDLEPPAPAMSP